ncbi:MAG: endolytic transglycosylase MltG [Crenarchaeota archaeon]|uniref:Endolytic transglycosylase MltG n=1 Tax=Atopococcus tabaci TaxID=269774 RepID=A0AA43UAU9_9LACT|nr:endolytic transglycosylase MltG [Atopococcus tabaci]NLE06623.1 endolytic transglycosylase MltG [Thermoproteota archaeon]
MRKFNFSKSNLRSAGIAFLLAGMIVSFAALFSPVQDAASIETGEQQDQLKTEAVATIQVRENSTAEEIGRSLADQGLIDDLETFETFMMENGYHENFQAGEYQINSEMTMKDIAQVVTGQTDKIDADETE